MKKIDKTLNRSNYAIRKNKNFKNKNKSAIYRFHSQNYVKYNYGDQPYFELYITPIRSNFKKEPQMRIELMTPSLRD